MKIQVTLHNCFLGWGTCKRCLANNEIQSQRSYFPQSFLLFAKVKKVCWKLAKKSWKKVAKIEKKWTFFDLTTYVTNDWFLSKECSPCVLVANDRKRTVEPWKVDEEVTTLKYLIFVQHGKLIAWGKMFQYKGIKCPN